MKKVVPVVLLCCLTLMPLFSMDLSIDEAVKLGIERNLSLKNAKLTLETSKNDYKYSFNKLLPEVTANATFSRANEDSSAIQRRAAGLPVPDPTWAFTYGISGTLTFNPALITNIAISKQSYANGEITYSQAEMQLKQNISKAYYGILLQEDSLKIQADTLKSQEERYKQALNDYNNGYIPEIAFLQSEVAYKNAIPSYQTSLRNVKNSKRQLALLLGLDVNEDLNLTSSIEAEVVSVSAEEALSTIGERFDIRLLDIQEKTLKLQKDALIESTFIPSLVLKASWQPYLYDIDKSGSDYWLDGGSISGTVAWNLSNLLPTSDPYKNLKNLKNGLNQVSHGKELAEEAARIEILNLLDTLNQTKTSLESSASTVALAEANYNMRQKAYSEGYSDYLDLVDAETSLNQAKLSRLANQYDYICALIDLEYATMQDFSALK